MPTNAQRFDRIRPSFSLDACPLLLVCFRLLSRLLRPQYVVYLLELERNTDRAQVVTPTTAATCTVSTPAPVASDTTTINGYCGITNGLSCGNGFGDCCSIYGACKSYNEHAISCSTACSHEDLLGTRANLPLKLLGGNTSEYCSTTQCDPAYGRCGGELTTNGYCGANANGALCGSNFGDCCSQYGACGNTTAYCGAGTKNIICELPTS